MPKQERIQKERSTSKRQEEVVDPPAADTKKTEALKDEMDEILETIDEVLEANAEDFVKSYVQAGGE